VRLAKTSVDWGARPIDGLLRPAYEATFAAELAAARVVEVAEVRRPKDDAPVRLMYSSHTKLRALCKQLGVMDDLKAGVPRTAYHGVRRPPRPQPPPATPCDERVGASARR
jgi:alpha-1,3-mannosyl-glycoprotein beta-1,2-N-acetylglucosaminyltransferase